MKKVLILGCSHSAGSYDHNDPNKADNSNGWPALISNNFPNWQVHCVTHFGGGILNYMWTLGYLIDKFGKDYFDKIIIEITDEPRLAMYNNQFNDLSQFKYTSDIKDQYYEIEKSFSSMTREEYVKNKPPQINTKGSYINYIVSQSYQFHDKEEPITVDENDLNDENLLEGKYRSFVSLNVYLILMAENFLTVIKSLYDDSKLFGFIWEFYPMLISYALPFRFKNKKDKKHFHEKYYPIIDDIRTLTEEKWKKSFPFIAESSAVNYVKETKGIKQELLYRMPDNSSHYDKEGNLLVYKYLEPHLESFLI